MKQQSNFTKVFTITAGVTVLSWFLAFGSAVLAGDKPFPKATLARMNKGLNESEMIDQTKQISTAGLKRLEVEVGSADMTLEPTDAKDVSVNIKGNAPKDMEIQVTESNGVTFVKVDRKSHDSWSFQIDEEPLRVTVSLPKSYTGDLMLKSGSGDILAGKVELAKLEIKIGSGDIKMDDLKIKTAIAKSGSGDFSVSKVSAADLSLVAGSGDISVEDLKSKSAEISTGSGEVTVKLKDAKNWTATARTGSGEIDSNLPDSEYSKGSHRLKAGKGDSKLNIDTGSGDIKISL